MEAYSRRMAEAFEEDARWRAANPDWEEKAIARLRDYERQVAERKRNAVKPKITGSSIFLTIWRILVPRTGRTSR